MNPLKKWRNKHLLARLSTKFCLKCGHRYKLKVCSNLDCGKVETDDTFWKNFITRLQ